MFPGVSTDTFLVSKNAFQLDGWRFFLLLGSLVSALLSTDDTDYHELQQHPGLLVVVAGLIFFRHFASWRMF
ncbi:hypothetical protein [Negadavirga shengliensis]|uniref:Uncharacterized protein n=1 Tax=Negadavirga shengliensis TaxID=1389218 RepID=A0ABV9SVQ0_9BACT